MARSSEVCPASSGPRGGSPRTARRLAPGFERLAVPWPGAGRWFRCRSKAVPSRPTTIVATVRRTRGREAVEPPPSAFLGAARHRSRAEARENCGRAAGAPSDFGGAGGSGSALERSSRRMRVVASRRSGGRHAARRRAFRARGRRPVPPPARRRGAARSPAPLSPVARRPVACRPPPCRPARPPPRCPPPLAACRLPPCRLPPAACRLPPRCPPPCRPPNRGPPSSGPPAALGASSGPDEVRPRAIRPRFLGGAFRLVRTSRLARRAAAARVTKASGGVCQTARSPSWRPRRGSRRRAGDSPRGRRRDGIGPPSACRSAPKAAAERNHRGSLEGHCERVAGHRASPG